MSKKRKRPAPGPHRRGLAARADKIYWTECPACGAQALTDGKIIACGACVTVTQIAKESDNE